MTDGVLWTPQLPRQRAGNLVDASWPHLWSIAELAKSLVGSFQAFQCSGSGSSVLSSSTAINVEGFIAFRGGGDEEVLSYSTAINAEVFIAFRGGGDEEIFRAGSRHSFMAFRGVIGDATEALAKVFLVFLVFMAEVFLVFMAEVFTAFMAEVVLVFGVQ